VIDDLRFAIESSAHQVIEPSGHRYIGSSGHFRLSIADLRLSDAALPVFPPMGFAFSRHSSLITAVAIFELRVSSFAFPFSILEFPISTSD
jgi:hypothetical protein